MKIIENQFLPFKGFKAITILNMIFVRKGTALDIVDVNHENIHWQQEKEMLIVGFYLWYLIEFIVHFILCWNFKKAYYNISFEREAYYNEMYIGYDKFRKHYAWIKFLCR